MEEGVKEDCFFRISHKEKTANCWDRAEESQVPGKFFCWSLDWAEWRGVPEEMVAAPRELRDLAVLIAQSW